MSACRRPAMGGECYLLPSGARLLLGDAASGRFGCRTLLIWGVGSFALASLACTAAPNPCRLSVLTRPDVPHDHPDGEDPLVVIGTLLGTAGFGACGCLGYIERSVQTSPRDDVNILQIAGKQRQFARDVLMT